MRSTLHAATRTTCPVTDPRKGLPVNKSDLVEVIADKLGKTKKETSELVEAVLDHITHTVSSGEKVSLSGFGVFEKQDRAARVGRNPRTGATVRIKATSVPKFRSGVEFKQVVAGKKRTAKKAAPAKKTTARKTAAKKTTARTTATKAPAKKAPAKKAPVKKTAVKKATVKKAPARKAPAKKATARKTTAKKTARR